MQNEINGGAHSPTLTDESQCICLYL